MDTQNSVLCYGGLHMDRIARCVDRFQLGASNPVRTQTAPGGVANNIARNLANFGVTVGVASLLGEDSDGDRLLADLKQRGVDSTFTRRRLDFATAGYTAVLDEGGELALGLADMEIYGAFDLSHLDELLQHTPASNWWLADANLPAITLNHLGKRKRDHTLCAAPVSPSKALRWKDNLGAVDIFVGNRREAAVLTNTQINTPGDAAAAARLLKRQGPGLVIITLGPAGVVMASAGYCRHWTPPPTCVHDVNGAGDAFYAGFIAASLTGDTPDQALCQGLALASLSAELPQPVNSMAAETLRQRVAQIVPPTTL